MFTFELNTDFKDVIATEIEHVSSHTPICPFILGEPGIGKSSAIRDMCKENGWYFYELLCNQLADRADLTGCRDIKTTDERNEEVWKQIFFPHAAVQDAISCAKAHPDDIVVLFLDEINRASSDITSSVLSFITARTIGTYTFPDNIRFIVAGNDKGNVTSLDDASISRFAQFKLQPTAKTYMEIEKNLNPYIKAVLTKHPQYIFGKNIGLATSTVSDDDGNDSFDNVYETFNDGAEGFNQITTPRTISGLNAFLNACTPDTIAKYIKTVVKDSDTGEDISMLLGIIEGHVGKTEFANELINEISTSIISAMHDDAMLVQKPQMPAVYKSLRKCADISTRDEMINNMSDEDKMDVILYALCEHTDNKNLISTVAAAYNESFMDPNRHKLLTKLRMQDELDEDNFNALITSGSKLGNKLAATLGE